MNILNNNIYKIVIFTVLLTIFSCSNDKEESLPGTNQEVPIEEKMLISVTTTSNNLSVKLPFTGVVNCEIDWNDGNIKTVLEPYPTHTYTKAGTYLIFISGTVTALNSSELTDSELLCITGVHNWGNTGLTSLSCAFKGCTNLTSLPGNDLGALDNITEFNHTFSNCSSLTELPSGLFHNCAWVTSFTNTFSGCSNLKEIPSNLFYNCTRVTSFTGTFSGCSALIEIPSGLFDNCTSAKDFVSTFQDCENLTEIPTALFDNCTRINYLLLTFAGCKNLTGESPYTMVKDKKVHLYERNRSIDGFVEPQYYYLCFNECVGLTDFAEIPDEWKHLGNE